MEDLTCVKPYTSKDKWIVSAIAGVLFLIVASPFLFKIMNGLTGIFGISIADPDTGAPNLLGLILHGVVFMLIVRLLMN
uniref:Transmembrane domain containing protein n=1 Tax=Marseillevirus sp. TaxID=2809551 RepID=A0AA96EMH6_9VIRU|nr:transmembrane domain containing protein [Marseillevirus sp.]